MRVYIGYDQAEHDAYEVARKTLWDHSGIRATPLDTERLHSSGLLRRIVDQRGQMYDLQSNAPCSTQFAVSRFIVPIICMHGWALFTDCDVVFMDDLCAMMELADPEKAVMVVKHNHKGQGLKMGGMVQTDYPRKNWSSVMLFNCNHPANRRLTLQDVNERPGRDLHRFYWLHDSEIGELPAHWNWLVNVMDKPDCPKIAHFTNGGPWIDGWDPAPHDEIWIAAHGER